MEYRYLLGPLPSTYAFKHGLTRAVFFRDMGRREKETRPALESYGRVLTEGVQNAWDKLSCLWCKWVVLVCVALIDFRENSVYKSLQGDGHQYFKMTFLSCLQPTTY